MNYGKIGRCRGCRDWNCCRTPYSRLHDKVDQLKRDVDRQNVARTTVDTRYAKTPQRFTSEERPLSAMRNTYSGCRSLSPRVYYPITASVGRKYYPKYNEEPIDLAALKRRRLRIGESLIRYSSVNGDDYNDYDYKNRKYAGMQGDLTDLRLKVDDHIRSLQVKEYVLQDELERLATERDTLIDCRLDTFDGVTAALSRPKVCRRRGSYQATRKPSPRYERNNFR